MYYTQGEKKTTKKRQKKKKDKKKTKRKATKVDMKRHTLALRSLNQGRLEHVGQVELDISEADRSLDNFVGLKQEIVVNDYTREELAMNGEVDASRPYLQAPSKICLTASGHRASKVAGLLNFLRERKKAAVAKHMKGTTRIVIPPPANKINMNENMKLTFPAFFYAEATRKRTRTGRVE